MTKSDPMEGMIRDALNASRLSFKEGDSNEARLDFYVEPWDIYIEVKQFHSERIAGQMSRVSNVIVAQGEEAVERLAMLIRDSYGEQERAKEE